MIGRLLPSLALAATLLLPPAACAQEAGEPAPPPTPDRLAELWEEGVVFDAFRGSAEARKATWDGNWETSEVPPELLARARAAVATGAASAGWRTPDGRAATPTVLLLDEGFRERGCMVERPPELQEWFLAAEDSLPREELYREKYTRYETDRGVMTVQEWVRVLEAAARGETRCVAETAGEG